MKYLNSPKLLLSKYWRVLLLLCVDALVFLEIDPKNAPSLVLMFGLVLLIVTIYVFISAAVNLLANLAPPLIKHRKRIKILSGMVVAFIVGLQSIGQLSAKDFAAVLPLILVGYFYITYSMENKSS